MLNCYLNKIALNNIEHLTLWEMVMSWHGVGVGVGGGFGRDFLQLETRGHRMFAYDDYQIRRYICWLCVQFLLEDYILQI